MITIDDLFRAKQELPFSMWQVLGISLMPALFGMGLSFALVRGSEKGLFSKALVVALTVWLNLFAGALFLVIANEVLSFTGMGPGRNLAGYLLSLTLIGSLDWALWRWLQREPD